MSTPEPVKISTARAAPDGDVTRTAVVGKLEAPGPGSHATGSEAWPVVLASRSGGGSWLQ